MENFNNVPSTGKFGESIAVVNENFLLAQQKMEELQALYNALQQTEPEIIEPSDTWPVANPEEGVIYRVIDRVNTPPQYYSDFMWNGTSMVQMARYNNAIDDEPTPGSANLVKSGGVAANIVYDISAAHSGTTYADLASALGTNGANVPVAVRKGGMSIKFIQGSVGSSDNKYVQYRLMADSFNTTEANWQKQGAEVTVSQNIRTKGYDIFIGGKLVGNFASKTNVDNIQFNLNGNGGTINYDLLYGKAFESSGYLNNNSYCCSQVFPAGHYIIPTVDSVNYQFAVYKYNSDVSGTLLYSYGYLQREFDIDTPFVVSFRRVGIASLTNEDYIYFSSLIVAKTSDKLSLEQIRAICGNVDVPLVELEQDAEQNRDTLNAYSNNEKIVVTRGKLFEASGFVSNASYCCTRIIASGSFSIPAMADSYLYEVYQYINNNEGILLRSLSSIARTFDSTMPIVITFKRSDSADLSDVDYAYINSIIINISRKSVGVDTYSVATIQEDSGALNYLTKLYASKIRVKIDKIRGNQSFYRIYKSNSTASSKVVLQEQCLFGVWYTMTTDLSQYGYLYIYQPSAGTTIENTSYKIIVESMPSMERLDVIDRTLSIEGKSVLMLGDSITQLPKTKDSYIIKTLGDGIVEYFTYKTGANVIRGGVGGGHLATRIDISSLTEVTTTEQAKAVLDVVSIVKALCTRDFTLFDEALSVLNDSVLTDLMTAVKNLDMGYLDILTIFAGTNDWTSECTIGNNDSTNVMEYKGAINKAIEMLCSTYPHLKVYLFTPIVRWYGGAGTLDWNNPSQFSDICVNDANVHLYEFAGAMKDVSKLNHIPCCDLYYELGWNKWNYHNFCLPNDGTHPYLGFEQIANKMASFIMSNQ